VRSTAAPAPTLNSIVSSLIVPIFPSANRSNPFFSIRKNEVRKYPDDVGVGQRFVPNEYRRNRR